MSVFSPLISKLTGSQAQTDVLNDDQKRIVKFRKLHDFYAFHRTNILKYLADAMSNTFSADTVAKMQFPLYNLTRKIIDQLAVAYMLPANRYVVVPSAAKVEGTETTKIVDPKAKADQDLYQEILAGSNINAAAKTWNRMAKLLTTCYVGVKYVKVNGFGKIEYEVLLPHDFDEVIERKDNYLEPERIQFARTFGGETCTVIWSDTEHRIEDKDGDLVPSLNPWGGVNKYKFIPYIPCRLSIPADHWGEGDTELVGLNEKVDILLASMLYNAIMQSHGILFGVNLHLDKKDEGQQVKTGPDRVVEVNDVTEGMVKPSLDVITPDPAIDANIKAADWLIKQAAMMKGLSAQSVSVDTNEQSGVSKIVDLNELRERRQDDIEFLRVFEKRLFDLTVKVWNFNETKQISDKAVFGIDFPEPQQMTSELDALAVKEKKMSMGLYTPVDDYIDEDEGIDEAQALAYCQRAMNFNRQIMGKMNDA